MSKDSFFDRAKKSFIICIGGSTYRSELKQIEVWKRKAEIIREWYSGLAEELRSLNSIDDIYNQILEINQEIEDGSKPVDYTEFEAMASCIIKKAKELKRCGIQGLEEYDLSFFERFDYTTKQKIKNELDEQGLTVPEEGHITGDVRKSLIEIDSPSIDTNLHVIIPNFLNRLREAFSVLTNGSDYQFQQEEIQIVYQEYQQENEKLDLIGAYELLAITQVKLARLKKETALMEEKIQDAESLLKEIDNAMIREIEQLKPGTSTPDYRVCADQIISKELQVIQEQMQEAEYNFKNAPKRNTGAKIFFMQDIEKIKAKLLGTLMAYSETLNEFEKDKICLIGPNGISLKKILYSIPQIFNYTHEYNSHSLVVSQNIREILTKQYAEILERFANAGVLKSPNITTVFRQRKANLFKHYDGFESLLNRYCGTNLPARNYESAIFQGFVPQRNPEPDGHHVFTPMLKSAALQIGDTIGKVEKDLLK